MMTLTRLRNLALGAGLLGLLAATAPAIPAGAAPAPGRGVPVTVMTRNLYLGGDIMRPLAATQGLSGAAALVAFANENAALWATVQQTNFPARAKLLAKEIATQKPDLVGLQEAALWRSGPLEIPPSTSFAVPDATVVEYDFLASLLSELAALGTPYQTVQVQTEADVEGPTFVGIPPSITSPKDIRLTMRDAILRPVDGRVRVDNTGGGQYVTRVSFPVGGVPFTFIRGYAWADVEIGAKSFRFIDTHLESVSSDAALGQAMELLAGPANRPGQAVVVVCDCNSDPLNHSVKPFDHVAHSAPYDFVTGHGFTDEWLQWAPADQGWTSGLSETVNDTTTNGFNHRIDMVFAHLATGDAMPVDQGTVVGTQLTDRNAQGLWPSDHGGVVLRVRP